jgi:RimJ/RimL family protein N-acetyltransferase
MAPIHELRTERLLLRAWRPSDRGPFARMSADPAVMEFYPAPLSPQEADAMVDRIETHFALHDFGPWACELRATGAFIGYTGLVVPRFVAAFTPCVEIGWRLDAPYWGMGLATEAARAVVRYAFTDLQLDELVSFTVPHNLRSRRVMEKLNMSHNPADDFDHPLLPVGHVLRRHVLYRLRPPTGQHR